MISNPQPISGSMTEQSGVEAESPKVTPILHIAWERYAQLNTLAKERSRTFRRLRIWIAVLGILATLFAILTQLTSQEQGGLQEIFSEQQLQSIRGVMRIFFISIPIIASFFATLGSRAFSNGDWLITRAAAEEYLKEIYLYRTVYQKKKNRRDDLVKRIDEIQRQLYRALGGELAFEPYKGRVPPYYNPDDPESDRGYDDLDGERYFRFRLDHQLKWHQRKVNEFKRERGILTLLILVAGGLGTLFAALGESLSIWVALTASITAALIGWQELRNIDSVIRNYSKVILELTHIHDDWLNLEPKERTNRKFYQMVRATEGVLWDQHIEYIRSQQEALKEAVLDGESEELDEPLTPALKDNIMEHTEMALKEAKKKVSGPIKEALGSLAAEASAEVIQPELEAMGKAVAEAAETMQESASSMTEGLQEVTEDIADAEINGNTSEEEVSDTPARFPETGEPAG